MFRHLCQISLALGLVYSGIPALAAKSPLCSRVLLSAEDLHNAKIRDQYLETNSFHYGILKIRNFKEAVQYYSVNLKGNQRAIGNAINLFNENTVFKHTVFDRYKFLISRKISPSVRERLDSQFSIVQGNAKRTGSFINPPTNMIERRQRLLEILKPEVDGLNVKWKKDRKNWELATDYLIDLIHQERKFTHRELSSIALILKGEHPDSPVAWAGFVGSNQVNYMLPLGKDGRKIMDPTFSFIPGSVKSAALQDFFKWLEKNEKKMNPIELAAEARTMIVSIHPLLDGNGRLGRLVANYILMRAGLPPAAIPRTEDGSSSVVLFPLKEFDEQIPPERSYQLMLDGVLRSQNYLLGMDNAIISTVDGKTR